MTANSDESQKILQEAVNALKRGDKVSARRLAERAASQIPESEAPWLILAALANPKESLPLVRKALQINPDSQPAKQALEWALLGQNSHPSESNTGVLEKTSPPVPSTVLPENSILVTQPPSKGKQSRKFLHSSPSFRFFAFLGVLIIALIVGLIILRPQWTQLLGRFFKGDGCNSMLILDQRSFEIKTLKTNSVGTLNVPPGHPDWAYWVQGTDVNLVFALAPVLENQSLLDSLGADSVAQVTWENCNTATYRLSSPVQSLPDNSMLFDQSISQITVFVPADAGSAGLVIHGELMEEAINTFDTPDATSVQAEVALLEMTPSSEDGTIAIGISVTNYGQIALILTMDDVSLIPETSDSLAPVWSDPPLPFTIEPGTVATIQFIFPLPSTPTAILKIVTVEYLLEDY